MSSVVRAVPGAASPHASYDRCHRAVNGFGKTVTTSLGNTSSVGPDGGDGCARRHPSIGRALSILAHFSFGILASFDHDYEITQMHQMEAFVLVASFVHLKTFQLSKERHMSI